MRKVEQSPRISEDTFAIMTAILAAGLVNAGSYSEEVLTEAVEAATEICEINEVLPRQLVGID